MMSVFILINLYQDSNTRESGYNIVGVYKTLELAEQAKKYCDYCYMGLFEIKEMQIISKLIWK